MADTALESLLMDRQPETLLLVPPAGNHGDALLRLGFRTRIETLGIPSTRFGTLLGLDVVDFVGGANPFDVDYGDVRSVGCSSVAALAWARHRLHADFDTIYIHGGGNFNEIWGDGIGCFRAAASLFDCDIIVGPQSYLFEDTDPADIFRDVSNEVYLFCRERYSYEVLNGSVSDLDHVDVALSPDTAFYLGKADLIAGDGTEEYVLVAFRGDRESSGSHEVNVPGGEEVVDEDISDTRDSLADFIEAVARAKRVYTDRLHVATLAAILEKPVTLYGNVYHKNIGVYEYSLSDYDHVEFVDPAERNLSS